MALRIEDRTQIGEARRASAALAAEIGLDEVRAGRLALIVTELSTNILNHAGQGQILLRPLDELGGGVEVLALDQGPGMADLARSFTDGYSTAESPGTGLGAVARLADCHDVYSAPGKGTALMARVNSGTPLPEFRLELGVVCLPHPAERIPGDGWDVLISANRPRLLVADGLGHGPLAAEAAEAAIAVFREYPDADPAEVLDIAHAALRSTRGATVAVAELRPEQQELHYCGIGNIGAAILANGESRSLVSHNGTVGVEARRRPSLAYPWSSRSVLLMYSDGLASRWDLTSYPGLASRHPAIIAGVLYRDFTRGRDDVTVVVARETRP
jgi:anti-sigma regulatory factor (Ser/Thr protein kinase)